MKIVLLGYMASGKTTLGKMLAKKIDLPFIDLDHYIEQKFKKSIGEIFDNKGEVFFRLQEHEALKEILANKSSLILSLGGGTPCYAGNMKIINNHKDVHSIYLKLAVNNIYRRLSLEKNTRPIVAHIPEEQLRDFVAKQLFERSFYYEQAEFKLNMNDKNISQALTDIENLFL